jgi:hypothetical protein
MGRTLPAHAVNYDGLFADWRRVATAQAEATQDLGVLRARLASAVALPSMAAVTRDAAGIISRGEGDHVPSLWTPGKGRPLVVIHPDGAAAGAALLEVSAAKKARRPVLVLQVFQTGSSKADRKRSHNHWLTFNVSDDQARVHDIAAALAWLPADADVLAVGAARYWAAVATAAAGTRDTLAFDVAALSADDQALQTQCFIPALQRAGGLRVVQRLVNGSGSWASSRQGSSRQY